MMRIESALSGAQLRRVAQPGPQLLAFEFSAPQLRGALLIGLSKGARGLGWVDGKLSGSGADPWLLKWKHQLVGARVASVFASQASLRVELERGSRGVVIDAAFERHDAAVRLLDDAGHTLAELRADGAADVLDEAVTDVDLFSIEALRSRADAMLRGSARDEVAAERLELQRAVQSSLRRARRRREAIEGDLARVSEVPRLRRDAGLVFIHLHELSQRCLEATLVDPATDEAITLRFAPELGPKDQAEAWFRRARRLERGVAIASERARATDAAIDALTTLGLAVQTASSTDALADCRERALALQVPVSSEAPTPSRKPTSERLPYREFRSEGRAIYVGRGAQDNDRLTLDHARPHDLWLHTRDAAGAHVIVPLARDEACPAELLIDAATLAAHFSRERGQALIDVLHTPRRFVRKPRKSATGEVTLMREKVLRLRLEPARVTRLLAAERKR